MARSKAEIVAAAMLTEWRASARLASQPSEHVLRAARETIVGLVAQDLLGEVLSGLTINDGFDDRWLVVQRWSFTQARPPLRPCWPMTRLTRAGDISFVLRLRPSERWDALSRAARREISEALPLDLDAAAAEFEAPRDLAPIRAERLPSGGYLVLESWLTPTALPGY